MWTPGMPDRRPPEHLLWRVVGAVALAITGVSCSSDDGDRSTSSTGRSQLTAPDATLENTAPSVTEPSMPSSDPPTTATSVPSTTAVDPDDAMRDEAAAALTALHESWAMCLSQMPNCDVTALADTRVDAQLADSQQLATEWNAAGYMARNLESLTYRIEDVSLDETQDRAVVTECSTDGVVLYIPLPDGQDQIVNDTWSSAREAWTMVRGADGRWRAADNETVTPAVIGEENNICA